MSKVTAITLLAITSTLVDGSVRNTDLRRYPILAKGNLCIIRSSGFMARFWGKSVYYIQD